MIRRDGEQEQEQQRPRRRRCCCCSCSEMRPRQKKFGPHGRPPTPEPKARRVLGVGGRRPSRFWDGKTQPNRSISGPDSVGGPCLFGGKLPAPAPDTLDRPSCPHRRRRPYALRACLLACIHHDAPRPAEGSFTHPLASITTGARRPQRSNNKRAAASGGRSVHYTGSGRRATPYHSSRASSLHTPQRRVGLIT